MLASGFHTYDFRLRTGRQGHVNGGGLVHGKDELRDLFRGEAGRGYLQGVAAGRDICEYIVANSVADCVSLHTGVSVAQNHRRIWQDGSGRVANYAIQGRARKLPERRGR